MMINSDMKKSFLLLRLSYWAAAIADFSIAILVLIPERMGVDEIVYPMGLASVVAFSWGVLLLIADRKPMERRWMLVPTIFVVILISLVRIMFSLEGVIAINYGLIIFAFALIILMAYSYYVANKYDTSH